MDIEEFAKSKEKNRMMRMLLMVDNIIDTSSDEWFFDFACSKHICLKNESSSHMIHVNVKQRDWPIIFT